MNNLPNTFIKISELLNDARNQMICRMYVNGVPQSTIAEEFNITKQRVHQVIREQKKKVGKEIKE